MYHFRVDEFSLANATVKSRRKAALPPASSRAPQAPRLDYIRVLDCILAATLLVFFAPLMLVTAIFVSLRDPGHLFFGQRRLGYGGTTFRCWKFRTMVVDADARLKALLETDPVARREWAADQKLRNDPRITKLGRFLRASSIDELPQLFNVLRGEMSLVGPRPIVAAEVVRYGRWFKQYCSVRPGLTGIWQVSGRNNVSYGQRVAMDILFARKRSMIVYWQILFATIPAVLLRNGSY